jgi:hypothetical protein
MLNQDHQPLLPPLASPSQALEGDLGESKFLKLNAPVMQGTLWNNYSSVPNRRTGQNKRAGGKILKKD